MQTKKDLRVALLTGGIDPHYALGLLLALVEKGIYIDFIGNDEMMDADTTKRPGVSYFNLRGETRADASLREKIIRVLKYYIKLIVYANTSEAKIFHILWLNKFIYFDRTLLNVYYRFLGKKLVFTAHNVNAGERDGTDSILNKVSLRFMYSLMDHIFVHTDKMRQQLVDEYKVNSNKVSVIRYGFNNVVPQSDLTRDAARHLLGLDNNEKVLLFFGNIAPYKGLEYLISAMALLKNRIVDLRLIIAGKVKGCEEYWREIKNLIDNSGLRQNILLHIRYVLDEEVEVFHKASDAMILPYKHIFQSGVLFLSYSFGLPVIASDVGSLRDDIIEGKTGFLCHPQDPEDLATKIESYFSSKLYEGLENNRNNIVEYVKTNNSWSKVGEITCEVFQGLL